MWEDTIHKNTESEIEGINSIEKQNKQQQCHFEAERNAKKYMSMFFIVQCKSKCFQQCFHTNGIYLT